MLTRRSGAGTVSTSPRSRRSVLITIWVDISLHQVQSLYVRISSIYPRSHNTWNCWSRQLSGTLYNCLVRTRVETIRLLIFCFFTFLYGILKRPPPIYKIYSSWRHDNIEDIMILNNEINYIGFIWNLNDIVNGFKPKKSVNNIIINICKCCLGTR